LNFLFYALVFYFNSLVILPRFLKKGKYTLLFFSFCLLLAFLLLVRLTMYTYVLPFLDREVLHPFVNTKLFIAQTIWRGGYFAMLSFGYFFANRSIQMERQKRKLADARRKRSQRLRKIENSLLEMELISLRNQINPHFLYNVLNYFYSQTFMFSESTAKGILLLSDIMRYALQEDEGNGKGMLEKEVQHLQNYITMNQLRFNNQIQVKFEVIGNLHYKMIVPLVLITFVENCFKHGELHDPENPVIIKVEVVDDQLFFYTHNKIRIGMKEKSTGIGMVNIKRRLELKYEGRYTLDIDQSPDYYTCKLVINL